MTAPKFKWMVIHHIDKTGIWFRPTDGTNDLYVFYWNPLRVLNTIFRSPDWTFGWFPFHVNHIKNKGE